METMQQVLAAMYVALGEAAGGPQAMRVANQVLRDAVADRAVDDPAAIMFLESISHDEDDGPQITLPPSEFVWFGDVLDRLAVA